MYASALVTCVIKATYLLKSMFMFLKRPNRRVSRGQKVVCNPEICLEKNVFSSSLLLLDI